MIKIKDKFSSIYETFIRNIDGAYGNQLRYKYYKKRLKYLGKNAIIDTGVYITGDKYISIGEGTHIDKGVILVASEPDIDISYRAVKTVENENINIVSGELVIGKDCHISQNCMIYAYGGVRAGNNCVMSAGAKIYSLSSLPNDPNDETNVCSIVPYNGISPTIIGPVEFEDNVWIGLDVYIFPGVKISKDSFVRTNSIVSVSFGENSYISGDPAKYIKPRFKNYDKTNNT